MAIEDLTGNYAYIVVCCLLYFVSSLLQNTVLTNNSTIFFTSEAGVGGSQLPRMLYQALCQYVMYEFGRECIMILNSM